MFPHFGPEAFVPALKALSLLTTPLPSTHPYVAPPPATVEGGAGLEGGDDLLQPTRRSEVDLVNESTIVPARIMFPRCTGEMGMKGWKDDAGLNEWVLGITLPGVPVEEKEEWDKRAGSGELIALERVVIVDRWAAHRHPDTYQWKKMMSHMAIQPSLVQDWFEPFRANALQSLGAPLIDDGPKKPVVVYLDRNRNSQSPRFNLESHTGLIKALKSISGRAEVHQSVLMNMRKEEIVKLMSTATIVISPHCAEFIHTMWMPTTPFSTVMEIFDSGSFVRDNQLLSEMLHHEHLIVREDGILPKEEWLLMDVEKGRGERWDDDIAIDPKIILDRVVRILDEYDSAALRDRAEEFGDV
ncbi:hypothetical protein BDY24DRAFT_391736 [Mrakia frigida]|uniref:uncharacterized protein n=1 Tax=Mrakia frigida TaxID=29902 RepID=UPI003FCC0C01